MEVFFDNGNLKSSLPIQIVTWRVCPDERHRSSWTPVGEPVHTNRWIDGQYVSRGTEHDFLHEVGRLDSKRNVQDDRLPVVVE